MDDYEKVLKELGDIAQALELSDKDKTAARSKLLKRLEKVTPDLFGKFLAERNASRACMSCGSPQLSVPESRTMPPLSATKEHSEKKVTNEWLLSQMHPYVTPTFARPDEYPRLANVDYRVSCLNCGHVMIYRAAPTVYWVESFLDNSDGVAHE